MLRGSVPSAQLFVAKAVPHVAQPQPSDRLSLQSVHVRRLETGDECSASGVKLTRSGRLMSIKPKLHWVIKSLPDGYMEVRQQTYFTACEIWAPRCY